VSLQGEPKEYGRQDMLWMDCLLGGVLREKYPYFLFREPSDISTNLLEVVFFNKNGVGIVQSISRESLIPKPTTTMYAFSVIDKGSGESGYWTDRSRFIIADGDFGNLVVRIDATTVLKNLFWKSENHWQAEILFTPIKLSPELLAKAHNIAEGIKRGPGAER
jgi:hypothetical protein